MDEFPFWNQGEPPLVRGEEVPFDMDELRRQNERHERKKRQVVLDAREKIQASLRYWRRNEAQRAKREWWENNPQAQRDLLAGIDEGEEFQLPHERDDDNDEFFENMPMPNGLGLDDQDLDNLLEIPRNCGIDEDQFFQNLLNYLEDTDEENDLHIPNEEQEPLVPQDEQVYNQAPEPDDEPEPDALANTFPPSMWQDVDRKLTVRPPKRKWTGTAADLFNRYGPSFSAVKNKIYANKFTTEDAENQFRARMTDGYYGKGRYKRRRKYTRRYRGRRRYSGRGGYWGRTIGGAVGNLFGAPWMADVGDKAGDFVTDTLPKLMSGKGMYTGRGCYEGPTSSNALVVGPHNEFDVPQFHPATDGSSVTISHKEYIGDLFAPSTGVAFANQTYKINPGLESTFPWLAQVAQNYVEYKIHQLIFTYKSTVADFAASSGQVGQIIGVTQYDANQLPMIDKRQMMEYDASKSCKTSSNLIMGVECDPNKNAGSAGKFVRTTPVDAQKDLNTYDVGTFNLAVHDAPATYANQVLGEVWVSYTIELRKPKVFTGRGLGIQRDIFTSPQWNEKVPIADTNIGVSSHCTIFGTQNNQYLRGERNTLGIHLEASTPIGLLIPLTKWGITHLTQPDKAKVITGFATPDIVFQNYQNQLIQSNDFYFPATYTGNIRMEIVLDMNNDTAILNPIKDLVLTSVGNISPINDVPNFPQKGASTEPRNFWTNTSLSIGSNGQIIHPEKMIVVLHFRVKQATDGLDNIVSIMSNAQSNFSLKSTSVTFEEYNTIGSYAQDGSNDHVVLVDATNTRVDLNPTWTP